MLQNLILQFGKQLGKKARRDFFDKLKQAVRFRTVCLLIMYHGFIWLFMRFSPRIAATPNTEPITETAIHIA